MSVDIMRSYECGYCLLPAIAKVQSVERKASFLFVGEMNAHHEKWLGSSTTNLHGRANS